MYSILIGILILYYLNNLRFFLFVISREFGAKCAGCLLLIDTNDLVMKTISKVFHTNCFRCTVCSKLLRQGDQMVLQENEEIVCGAHFDDEYNTEEGTPASYKDNVYNIAGGKVIQPHPQGLSSFPTILIARPWERG